MRDGDKTPLKERFDAASLDFEAHFLWKYVRHRAGTRFYPRPEFEADLGTAARKWGLTSRALWTYFRLLNPPGELTERSGPYI